jgi:hypothetical protein
MSCMTIDGNSSQTFRNNLLDFRVLQRDYEVRTRGSSYQINLPMSERNKQHPAVRCVAPEWEANKVGRTPLRLLICILPCDQYAGENEKCTTNPSRCGITETSDKAALGHKKRVSLKPAPESRSTTAQRHSIALFPYGFSPMVSHVDKHNDRWKNER